MFRRRIMSMLKTEESEGNPCVFESNTVRSLKNLKILGSSNQETTTGAQLLNLFDYEKEENGVVCSIKDGKGILNGTATGGNSIFWLLGGYSSTVPLLTLQPGDYFCKDVKLQNYNGTNRVTKTGYFTLSEEFEVTGIYYQVNAGETVNKEIYPMLNEGSTALPWEPYTGGQPSPNPQYPQAIDTAGQGGQIGVSVTDGGMQSQSLILSTPNGLPGVPVDASATEYTYQDASGQKWIADSVEMFADGTGQLVQRTILYNANDLEWRKDFVSNLYRYSSFNHMEVVDRASALSNRFVWKYSQFTSGCFSTEENKIRVNFEQPFESVDALIQWFSENDTVFLLQLATPITTPLSAEEVAAFRALTTYEPTTVVQNDAGCWIKTKYTKRNL